METVYRTMKRKRYNYDLNKKVREIIKETRKHS